MIIIDKKDLPLDHGYYRTTSPVYKKYLGKCKLGTHDLPNHKFGWVKRIFLWAMQIAKFERVNEEPDIKALKAAGFKRGIVIWIPYSRTDIPAGWKKLWLNSHFTTTGFSVVEDENYFKKWKERSRRARKKFLANPDVRIELVDTATFQKYYKESKISQPYKSSFVKYHESISSFDEKWDVKNMVCFYKDKVVAGLSVINYNGNSTAHLVSFLTNEGKTIQAGTWLFDYRFKMSLENGIKYVNFDHLRDKHMTSDQQGYTDFKENFMDYKVIFKESYFKFVGKND